MRHATLWPWPVMMAILVLLFALSISIGSVYIPLGEVWSALSGNSDNNIHQYIIWDSRWPRALAALLGGSALAVAGLLMQTLFRNPLAGPSVLGLSSGASLAVAAITLVPGYMVLGRYGVIVAAIAGSMAVLLIVLAVSRRFADVSSVLIVGLMLSFFASAIVGFLQSMADEASLKAYIFWGFGTFANIKRSDLVVFAIPVLLVLALSPVLIKPLNALLPGELHARTLGVHIGRTRLRIMIATGILTGVVTAFCGPVAFIGLAAPHMARFTFKTMHHTIILPAAMLWGAMLALGCDVIARLPGLQASLPLNTVCALMGAPVVVYLIVAGNKRKMLL